MLSEQAMLTAGVWYGKRLNENEMIILKRICWIN
jgi:hypothetical protein